jgi:HPr kinase/phosphorylase
VEKEFQKLLNNVKIGEQEIKLNLQHFLQYAASFNLKQLINIDLSKKYITVVDVYRPALVLAGYSGNFLPERIQILGEAEISYLFQMCADEQKQAINNLVHFTTIPAIIISKNLEPPAYLIQRCLETNIPLFVTDCDTTPFIHNLTSFLKVQLAQVYHAHGTLVDVHGVGLLLSGDSGIGKSEIALDLIERGHRLVADDIVTLRKLSGEVIMGYANERIGHNMEIRGVGIINVEPIFGIRSIRVQKRVEVIVNLIRWKPDLSADLDRAGLEEQQTSILGVPVSQVIIPIFPGKNITVICEVIAMRHMIMAYGKNMALDFEKSLQEYSLRRHRTLPYLIEDTE